MLGWLLGGCSSPDGGIPTELSHGPVKVGDTPDMVYAAIGRPDQRADVPNAVRYASVWTYQNYFNAVENPRASGWREVTTPEIRNQHDQLVHQAVLKDLPRTPLGGTLRVTFVGGVVSSVARVKE